MKIPNHKQEQTQLTNFELVPNGVEVKLIVLVWELIVTTLCTCMYFIWEETVVRVQNFLYEHHGINPVYVLH